MTDIIINVLLLGIGVVALYYGADFLVRGGANIARILNLKPMVIGLTVVAFGTSMPEFLVSISAAFKGEAAVAIGNVVGSNIANIALILGFSAMVSPIFILYKNIRSELLFLLASSLFFSIVLFNGVGRIEAAVLILIISFYTFYLIKFPGTHPVSEDLPEKDMSLPRNVFFVLLGLVGLVLGSNFMVDSAVFLAIEVFKVSPIVVGMTIVAVGTSLPELAASAVAALKKQTDISIGNIIGSNIFNMFFVIGGVGLVRDLELKEDIFSMEIPIMVGYVLLLFPLTLLSGGVKRWQGVMLLLSYFIFNIILFNG